MIPEASWRILIQRGKALLERRNTEMKNHTMMQYFEWYLPENGLHWRFGRPALIWSGCLRRIRERPERKVWDMMYMICTIWANLTRRGL